MSLNNQSVFFFFWLIEATLIKMTFLIKDNVVDKKNHAWTSSNFDFPNMHHNKHIEYLSKSITHIPERKCAGLFQLEFYRIYCRQTKLNLFSVYRKRLFTSYHCFHWFFFIRMCVCVFAFICFIVRGFFIFFL